MLPEETILSVFPSSVVCGKTALRPMTLSHVVALEALKIPYDGICPENAMVAAWVLSLEPKSLASIISPASGEGTLAAETASRMAGWMAKNGVGKDAAYQAVAETLRLAFLTYVPRANGGKQQVQLSLKGYGWPLEIAETMMSRYRMAFDEAMELPLCRLFAILAAGNAASGYGGGPDYYERIEIAAIKRRKVEALKARLKEAETKAEKEA